MLLTRVDGDAFGCWESRKAVGKTLEENSSLLS